MLYQEFLEGTDGKDNQFNYQIYKELEIIYMNTDCTKQHIYDLGKKLIDNTWKTEEQKQEEERITKQINEEIENLEFLNRTLKEDIAYKKYLAETETDPAYKKVWKGQAKYYREEIKANKNRIEALKWVIA